jgi:hypothetical protein
MSGRAEIDDAQAQMRERQTDLRIAKITTVIRPAMADGMGHALEGVGFGFGAFACHPAGYAAHGVISLFNVVRDGNIVRRN